MMRAGHISLGAAMLASAASAQEPGVPIACGFTLVCAPEIECEAHDGIPFEIDHGAGEYRVEIDGSLLVGSVLTLDPITIVFADGRNALLFTLDGASGALSRHESGPSGLRVATFTGPCVTG
jgi:hypothetical protein